MLRRFADLPDRIGITMQCGCTRVLAVNAAWMMERLGPEATVDDAERRLICRTCRARPRLTFDWEWGTRISIRYGNKAPPLPSWCRVSA